jgi:hypothetical protein
MNRRRVLSAGLIVLLLVTSYTFASDWSPLEQLGLPAEENVRLRYVSYNPERPDTGEKFALYYFTLGPFKKNKPSVLFIAGGPGIVPTDKTLSSPTVKSFIDSLKNEYNIVYFHLRGSGYSQFPESNCEIFH